MKAQASPSKIILAVAKAIDATFDGGKWLELGLLTDTSPLIRNHPRLLRALDWGDPDYWSCVLEVVPTVLGENRSGKHFRNLMVVEDFVGLRAYLRQHEPNLYADLYGGEDLVPVEDVEATAARLGIEDVDLHAARIRLGLRDDPAQAVGSAKELLETVLKAILGLHGAGPETRLDMPQLLKAANSKLGLDPKGPLGQGPGGEERKLLLASLGTIVRSAAELRNKGLGTGHGGSRNPKLDVPTARLAVAAAIAAATFYLEASEGDG